MSMKLIRPRDAAKQAGISISHLYTLTSQNEFPQPIKISERVTAFLESEVEEWIQDKVDSNRNSTHTDQS
ncbi:MAG: AlpA family phage regulatory protein [Emcibacteraceae bacterium]|nr:AlpA family phage regulatory protein [Emcibacteraceae bacterium]